MPIISATPQNKRGIRECQSVDRAARLYKGESERASNVSYFFEEHYK